MAVSFSKRAGEQTHQSPTLMRTQTNGDTESHMWVETDLGVLGDPVAQHVENPVGCSSTDDEVFIAGSLRVSEHCKDNLDNTTRLNASEFHNMFLELFHKVL